MAHSKADSRPVSELGLHQLCGPLLLDEDLECERWYEAQPLWPNEGSNFLKGSKEEWAQLAMTALASSSRLYEKRANGIIGDVNRVSISKEKTVGDKIAAYALAIQESPVHRLDELYNLLSLARKKGRQERAQAIEVLKDLFVSDLLPDGRQLLPFSDRNFKCDRNVLSKRHLVYAWFESEVKNVYREFVQVLEDSGKDGVVFVKQKAVKVIFELLVSKPENEKTLLFLLVNKVGDPDRKVSSTASNCLTELIEKRHPQMRVVVVREVERMLLRSNVKRRTQYYAVVFLNQITFRHGDTQLARDIIRLYMNLFSATLRGDNSETALPHKKIKKRWRNAGKKRKKSEEEVKPEVSEATRNSRLMAAILRGVNRAFPFTDPEQNDTSYDKYFNQLFCVAHADSFGSATQALALLYQVTQANSVQSDRFYKALYSRILDAAECSEAVQATYLNLLFKSMKDDTNPRRVKAFLKRLLQAASFSASGFAAACLIVSSECFQYSQKGLLKSFVSLPEKDDDDELFFDADQLSKTDEAFSADGVDVDSNGDEKEVPISDSLNTLKGDQFEAVLSAPGESQNGPSSDLKHYDPCCRDPKHAGAERTSLWEAVGLSAHYHPSVCMFAKTTCKEMKAIETTGDPLVDFSLIAFLDRFCYKRVKNRIANSLNGKRSARYRDVPLANSVHFQELAKAGKVEEDDKFFAKFFETNPDRVVDINEDGGREPSYGSDADSEEAAFEQALNEELKRLGAEPGVPYGPDVDDDDDDELRALDEAFGNGILESEDDVDDNELAGVQVSELPGYFNTNPTHTNGVENFSEGYEDDFDSEGAVERNGSTWEQGVGKERNVFASADAYQMAIDKDLADSMSNGEKNIISQAPETMYPISHKGKRCGHKRNGPRKKKAKLSVIG